MARCRNHARRFTAPACALAIVACLAPLLEDAAGQDLDARMKRVRSYMENGRMDRADREISHVLQDEPANPDVHRLLCELRRVESRRDDAVAACRRATELAPSRADLQLDLGDLLAQRDDGIDEALRAYLRASDLEPQNARPHLNLGALYERRGRHQEAEVEFREALEIDPNLVQANAGLGSVLFMTGRLAEARGYLGRAIELRPRDLRSHIFLGLALNHDGQYDLALLELRTAVGIDPHSANGAVGVQEQKQRFEHLRDYFKAQLEAQPKDATTWNNVAVLSYYLRDYETSWKHLVRAGQLGYPVDQGLKEVVYARWKRLSDT
jgi:tetratricopeptide (TPR) repeat protein